VVIKNAGQQIITGNTTMIKIYINIIYLKYTRQNGAKNALKFLRVIHYIYKPITPKIGINCLLLVKYKSFLNTAYY